MEVQRLGSLSAAKNEHATQAAGAAHPTITAVRDSATTVIKSLSGITTGITANLLSRAADVVLKERRRLVLVRETPLRKGHLRSVAQASEMGAIVMPPVPAFYTAPRSVDDIVSHTVGRMLDLFGIESAW